MHIARLELRNYTVAHKCTVVDLPDRGVVLITGKNGAGKSTIVEAVSMGGWGESLRGKAGWTDDPGQLIVATHDGLVIDRRRVKGKTKLSFAVSGVETKYDTAEKAQVALLPFIGSHDVWARSAAFSSRDSVHFTEATDAERKRLLEIVLGSERLDGASRLARDDLRDAKDALAKLQTKIALLKEREHSTTESMTDAQARLAEEMTVVAAAPSDSVLKAAKAADQAATAAMEDARRDERALERAADAARDALERIRRSASAVCKIVECPTCKQGVSNEHKDAVNYAASIEIAKLSESVDDYDDKVTALRKTIVKRTKAAQAARDSYQALASQKEAAVSRTLMVDQAKAREATLRQRLLDVYDELDALDAGLKLAGYEVDLLQVVEQVLSTRGVRAHLLHNALAVIEGTANDWLAKIASADLKLRLTPYAETSKGQARDVIGMEIEGAGGGLGYKAASGGERRRIDIALMLALGEVASAAMQQSPGTIFFDEVFDALDGDGVQAVCDMIQELGQTHCVVVISHNEEVVRGVQSTAAWIKL